MMQIHDSIEQNIDTSQYELINPNGLGFPVVVFPKSSGLTYSELISQTEEYILQIQKYCLSLFKKISATSDSTIPVIGYISNYTKSKTGLDIPAFKLYPMSYRTTQETLKASLLRLVEIKNDFDREIMASSGTHEVADIVFQK